MVFKNYKAWIEDRLKIVNKTGDVVPFKLNKIQEKFCLEDSTGRDIILKARQQGFSSLILGIFTADFILKENSRSVVVADIDDNSTELLDRVKKYIQFFEDITGAKVSFKYNSKSELYNEANGARYTIGTAKNAEFGRSKTITNLHLSEFAFYPDPERLLASAVQAVPENGRIVIETTADGFNFFKEFWDRSVAGHTGYKAHFYGASQFYDEAFLEKKKQELGRLFVQEYPDTALEAFVSSGDMYFDSMSLKEYLRGIKVPMYDELIYGF